MIKTGLMGMVAALLMTISAQAADFKWMDKQGDLRSLSGAYGGQPVVVHFWASWCPPCVAEMPEMAAWLKEHPEVKFLAVSVDSSLTTAQSFLQRNNIPLETVLTDSAQSSHLAVRGLPTTILMGATHNIISTHVGMQDWQEKRWENRVLKLFPSSGGKELAQYQRN